MKRLNILVFEDEQSIADTLVYALTTEGFSVRHVKMAQDGLKLFATEKFDLIVLDVGLPDATGFEVCKQIRKTSDVPVFFLTARGEEIDRIVGLEIGADDYITKPFSPREVCARIKTLFRRLDAHAPTSKRLARGPFTIDDDKLQIAFHGRALELTRYEFRLLELLVRNVGRVYSRQQLMEQVWEDPDMSLERTVDTHVKSLRAKLRSINEDEVILTHRGLGYSIKDDLI